MTNVKYVKQMLELMGVGADRVEMFFCSAAEGAKFSEVVREMTKKISELGPSPLKIKLPAEEEGTS
jgi:F420-non-reducing hydrogenase iron-sulfur subunit